MKLKPLFLLGASLMILSACGNEDSKGNGTASEDDGMGTLSSESESGDETVSEETSSGDTESNEDSVEETEQNNGLLDLSETENGWINFDGVLGGSYEYRTSQPVEYNPEQNYDLSTGAYIAYFNGDEFIQTVLYNEPTTIEQVPEADNIRVSYHNSFESKLALNEQ